MKDPLLIILEYVVSGNIKRIKLRLCLELENHSKKAKKNDFLMFGFTIKNIKKIKSNQNSSKIYIFLNFLVLI